MDCADCQYLGRNCGGVEGDPGLPTVDALSLSSRQLVEIACTLARVGTVICDLGKVGGFEKRVSLEPPYIWDIKEED